MKERQNLETGVVVDVLPSTTFKVELASGRVIRAHLSGKMKINHISILLQDRVSVFVSGELGRIERRL